LIVIESFYSFKGLQGLQGLHKICINTVKTGYRMVMGESSKTED